MSEWQDISTAPKDETEILVWCDPYNYIAFYEKDMGWVTGEWWQIKPTHWIPIPQPPEEKHD